MIRHATIRVSIIVIVAMMMPLTSPGSTTASSSFDAEGMSAMIEASHQCRKNTIPGLTVSVVKERRKLLARGYGFTSPLETRRVTENTRFNVASLTKAITAALLVKILDESGRFNLSTPVREVFGRDFRFADDLRTEHATVEDLLSHKMAVPGNSRIRFDSTLTRKSIVERVRYLKSYDTFRTTFIYSNIMYGIASRMAEVVGRGRYEDLVRRHFFKPLGMERSSFSSEANYSDLNTAKPYVYYKGKLEPLSYELPRRYSELVGSGAFITTANDMAKWMNFHLYGGVTSRGQRLMKQDLVAELHKPRTAMLTSSMPLFRQPDVPFTTSFDIYGLGWWTGYYRGYPIVGHSGASYGFRAFVVLVPSLKIGVFVGLNGDDRGYSYRGPLINLILDNLLGVAPWVTAHTLCNFPAPWHNVSNAPRPPYDARRPLAHNVSAYLGVYENPAYGRLEIKLAEEFGGSGVSSSGRRHSVRGFRATKDEDDQNPPRLTLIFGFARWILVPLVPKHAAVNSKVSSRADFPEYFYGIGKGVTAFIDYGPFIFEPPPTGSDVIEKISATALEPRLPPVFMRVASGGSVHTQSSAFKRTFAFVLLVVFLIIN